jgi:hypothetical protein
MENDVMFGTFRRTRNRRCKWSVALPMICLALVGAGCDQDIVEPPPIYGIVTGRVVNDAGQGVAGASVTIALDPVNRMPESGHPHLVSVDTVSTVDGTFHKTIMVGGSAPFDAAVMLTASPPSGSGLQADSVTGTLQLRTEEPYDTVTLSVLLPPH